jgi:hypothetical protein
LSRDRYQHTFRTIRPTVLERDHHKCVKCAVTESLEVHHIEGYKTNDPDLLATLCYLCHGVAPMGKARFAEWLQSGQSGTEVLQQHLAKRGLSLDAEQITAFCAALVEINADLRVSKFRTAREHIRKSGIRCEGTKPFGTFDGEQDALRQLLELNAQGKSTRAITAILNERNVPTRGSKKWHHASVAKILKRVREGRYRGDG